MRILAIAAVGLALSTVGGTASAAAAGGKVLICLRTTTTKTVTVGGKLYNPGLITTVNKPDATRLIALKTAAALNPNEWQGQLFCLIDANGRAIRYTQGDPAPTTPPAPPTDPVTPTDPVVPIDTGGDIPPPADESDPG